MAEADVNSEAQSESMPVLKSERPYGFKDYTVVITGFACAAWCFITGGSLALYVDAGDIGKIWSRRIHIGARHPWWQRHEGIPDFDVHIRYCLAGYPLYDGGEGRWQYRAWVYRNEHHYRCSHVHSFGDCRRDLLDGRLEGPCALEEAQ